MDSGVDTWSKAKRHDREQRRVSAFDSFPADLGAVSGET